MSFTDAWVAWIGIPLTAVVVLWHVLRTHATPRVIPSLQLWQQLVSEQASRRPMTWPVPWWLVCVRGAICSLLVLAAAGPVWASSDTQPSRIIVIDTSVSMQTRTVSGTRIDMAKHAAHALIGDAPVGTRFTIISVNHTMHIHASQLQDRTTVQHIVDEIAVTDVAGDMQRLLPLIRQVENQRSTVYFISDDAAMWRAARWPQSWQLVPIGGAAPNQGIQGMTLQTTSTGWVGTVVVSADGAWPTPRLLEVRDMAGTLYDATYVQPGENRVFEWTFQLAQPPAVLVATLGADVYDTLPADDAYWWRAPATQAIRVYLQSADTYFLPAALRVLPNIVRVAQLNEADIAIIDSPAVIPTAITMPTWLIHPPMQPAVSFPIIQPELLRGDAALLAQDVDIAQTQIITASVLQAPLWAQPWIRSSAGIHAYVGSNQGVAQVVFGIALSQSDLPLRADFPLLVRNVIRFLVPQTPAESLQTGQSMALPSFVGNVPRLTSQPQPASAQVQQQQDQWYLVDIMHPGAYRVDQQWYVANILAPWESATQRPDVSAPGQSWMRVDALSARMWGIWVALLFLLVERGLTWYTRRVT